MSNSSLKLPSGQKDEKPSAQKPDVQFITSNIGRWKSSQENPFAEQNRKEQAKKQAKAKRNAEWRKKLSPVFIIICAILAIGLAIFGLVVVITSVTGIFGGEDYSTPEISGSSEEAIADYRDVLNKFYNRYPNASEEEKYQEIDRVVNETLKTDSGEENSNAVKLALMGFCMENGCYQQSIDAAQSVDVDKLTTSQLRSYYNVLANCYYWIGDTAKAEEYFNVTDGIEE